MKSKIRDNRGFALTELVVVVAIMSVLLGIAGILAKGWFDRYNAESQMRQMHADLLQARLKAMEKNKLHFVLVGPVTYTISEDTNGNGTQDTAPDDTILMQKTLKYPAESISSNPTSTVALPVNMQIDQRGLISFPSSPNACSVSIRFDTGTASPEYDCFEFYATRINLGKWNGGSCETR